MMSSATKMLKIIHGQYMTMDSEDAGVIEKKRDPRDDKSSDDNQFCKNTKNLMVLARDGVG